MVAKQEFCKKRGADIPVFVTYYNKENQAHVVDKPILYSELLSRFGTRDAIVEYLCGRCNRMGELSRRLGEDYSLPKDITEAESKQATAATL